MQPCVTDSSEAAMPTVYRSVALDLHRKGFVVIPLCWPGPQGECACPKRHTNPHDVGKAPLLGKDYQQIRPDEATVSKWWTDWPRANIGVLLEPSGLIFIGPDSEAGERFAEEQGLPQTVIRFSNHNGYLYRRPDRCPVGSIVREGFIDIKSNGFAVVYGRHRLGDFIYLVGEELAEAPQWAVALLTESTTEPIVLPDDLPKIDVDSLEVPDRIKKLIREGPDAEPGHFPSRSEATWFVMRSLVDAGYDDETIASVMLDPDNAISERQYERKRRWLEYEIGRARGKPSNVVTLKPGTGKVSLEDWEPPIPFYQTNLPQFPVSSLPTTLGDYVRALAQATQTPVDLPAVLSLAAVAASVQRKCEVKLKKDWQEPLNIYVACVLPSGSRKTTVVNAVSAPIEFYEAQETVRMRAKVASAEAERKMLDARMSELQRIAAKAEVDKLARVKDEIKQLASELANLSVPVLPRLLADDVTPEKLVDLLDEQGGRIAIFSAEGKVFDLMTGRYNQVPNFDVFLNAHCGETIRVDRLGRKGNYVARPALTLGLAVQPDVIRGLMQTPTLRGRGLLARFMYSWPESTLGGREIDPDPLPDEVKAAYADMLLSLCEIRCETNNIGQPKPHLLELGEWATKSFREFRAWIEPQLAMDGALGYISDWAGKLAGLVARISALLHLAEHAGEEQPWLRPISGPTMEAAIEIGRYAIDHARAAFGEMGADQTVQDAKHILRWIEREGLQTFTKHEADRALKGHFKTVTAMEPALTLLIAQGYLRQRKVDRQSEKGRRPGPAYDVNPYRQGRG